MKLKMMPDEVFLGGAVTDGIRQPYDRRRFVGRPDFRERRNIAARLFPKRALAFFQRSSARKFRRSANS